VLDSPPTPDPPFSVPPRGCTPLPISHNFSTLLSPFSIKLARRCFFEVTSIPVCADLAPAHPLRAPRHLVCIRQVVRISSTTRFLSLVSAQSQPQSTIAFHLLPWPPIFRTLSPKLFPPPPHMEGLNIIPAPKRTRRFCRYTLSLSHPPPSDFLKAFFPLMFTPFQLSKARGNGQSVSPSHFPKDQKCFF